MRTKAWLWIVAIGLTGCTSTDPGVEPAKSSENASATAVTSPSSPQSMTAVTSGARVQLAPIIGSTVGAVTPLSRRLSLRAREAGLTLVPAGDPQTTHLVKGYFSALPEGSTTTVVYVFDILDTAGNRLHRIQGRQDAPGANSAEPWSAVPAPVMESIADRTMAELTAWLSTSS